MCGQEFQSLFKVYNCIPVSFLHCNHLPLCVGWTDTVGGFGPEVHICWCSYYGQRGMESYCNGQSVLKALADFKVRVPVSVAEVGL